MRKSIQAFVLRLPISYFDSTKTGILISRIMTDAEGIRNLVGTGLVQLVGGLVTASIALGVLFWLNWKLTAISILVLALFGGGMAYAFSKLRPLFRERGKLNADVTGRLSESLSGIRIVKAYHSERGERLVFARGAHKLFRNVATTMTGVSGVGAFAQLVIGAISVVMILVGGRAVLSGSMTLGQFVQYVFFVGLVALPLINIASIGTQITEAFAGLDRIYELRRMTTEDADDAQLAPLAAVRGDVAFEHVTFAYKPGVPVLKDVAFHARAGSTTALVGSSGSGKSTLVGLVLARLPRTSRSRGRTRVEQRSRPWRASRTATSSWCSSTRSTTRWWVSGGSSCPADSGSASRSRAPFSPTRGFWFWTKPLRASIRRARPRFRTVCARCAAAARRSSSRTGFRRSAARIRSWC
jgi:subfamily B ATP-binding cassette protein MsbA